MWVRGLRNEWRHGADTVTFICTRVYARERCNDLYFALLISAHVIEMTPAIVRYKIRPATCDSAVYSSARGNIFPGLLYCIYPCKQHECDRIVNRTQSIRTRCRARALLLFIPSPRYYYLFHHRVIYSWHIAVYLRYYLFSKVDRDCHFSHLVAQKRLIALENIFLIYRAKIWKNRAVAPSPINMNYYFVFCNKYR